MTSSHGTYKILFSPSSPYFFYFFNLHPPHSRTHASTPGRPPPAPTRRPSPNAPDATCSPSRSPAAAQTPTVPPAAAAAPSVGPRAYPPLAARTTLAARTHVAQAMASRLACSNPARGTEILVRRAPTTRIGGSGGGRARRRWGWPG
jgi:hypothetical protein